MHYEDFVPDALASSDDADVRAFLLDMLRQMERHRDWVLKEARNYIRSDSSSLADLDRRLAVSQEHYIGWQIWNSVGELQGHSVERIDKEIVKLQILESTIRHIRNFLYPEEVQMIEDERKARRSAAERRKTEKSSYTESNPDVTRPRKRQKPARTKKEKS